jgi:hypothetical protein
MATGMQIFCAQYKQLTTVTLTTVLAKMINARCQAGMFVAFAMNLALLDVARRSVGEIVSQFNYHGRAAC